MSDDNRRLPIVFFREQPASGRRDSEHREQFVRHHGAEHLAIFAAGFDVVEVRGPERRLLERSAGTLHVTVVGQREAGDDEPGWIAVGGRSSTTAFTTLKIAVVTPIPSASVRIAVAVKPGVLASVLRA